MHIRNAEKEDIPAILAILNYEILYSTSLYFYNARTLEEQIQWFQEKKKDGLPILVAEKNKEIIGFGTYGTFRPQPASCYTVEHSIYVGKEYRNLGTGKHLLEALILLAKKAKLHSMVGVVDSKNTQSILFHERFGFKNTGTIRELGFKFDQWLDVTFMQLLLH